MIFNKGQMFNSIANNAKSSTFATKVTTNSDQLGRRMVDEIKKEMIENNINIMQAKATYTKENIKKEEALAQRDIKKVEEKKPVGRVEIPLVGINSSHTIKQVQNGFKSFNNRGL